MTDARFRLYHQTLLSRARDLGAGAPFDAFLDRYSAQALFGRAPWESGILLTDLPIPPHECAVFFGEPHRCLENPFVCDGIVALDFPATAVQGWGEVLSCPFPIRNVHGDFIAHGYRCSANGVSLLDREWYILGTLAFDGRLVERLGGYRAPTAREGEAAEVVADGYYRLTLERVNTEHEVLRKSAEPADERDAAEAALDDADRWLAEILPEEQLWRNRSPEDREAMMRELRGEE